jgi:hypothetical protein
MKYQIKDGDLGIEYADHGPWRSYEISEASGLTKDELLNNLTVSEVDQDGGELRCYGYHDAPFEVQQVILKRIQVKQYPAGMSGYNEMIGDLNAILIGSR